jgi:hypothetical protein
MIAASWRVPLDSIHGRLMPWECQAIDRAAAGRPAQALQAYFAAEFAAI